MDAYPHPITTLPQPRPADAQMPRQDADRVILPAGFTPEQFALLLAATQPPTPPQPQPQPAPPVDTRVSGRAKGAALVAVSGGLGVGAATTGIGYGAGMIASASEGLMTAALALALGSASITGLVLFLRTAFSRGGQTVPQPSTHITQNITAPGMFGRANGTINHR